MKARHIEPVPAIAESYTEDTQTDPKVAIADIVLDLLDHVEFSDGATFEMLRGVAQLGTSDEPDNRRVSVQFFNPDYQHGASGSYKVAKLSTVIKSEIDNMSHLTSFLLTYNPFSVDKYELSKIDARRRDNKIQLRQCTPDQEEIVLHWLRHFKPIKD